MQAQGAGLEGDVFIRYPVMLEQCLMEGAYDKVWGALKGDGVPSEEFAVFSEVRLLDRRGKNISDCIVTGLRPMKSTFSVVLLGR